MNWWGKSTRRFLQPEIILNTLLFHFSTLLDISIELTTSVIKFKNCAITAERKKYNSIIKKRKRCIIK